MHFLRSFGQTDFVWFIITMNGNLSIMNTATKCNAHKYTKVYKEQLHSNIEKYRMCFLYLFTNHKPGHSMILYRLNIKSVWNSIGSEFTIIFTDNCVIRMLASTETSPVRHVRELERGVEISNMKTMLIKIHASAVDYSPREIIQLLIVNWHGYRVDHLCIIQY